MKIEVQKSNERGKANYDWLSTYYSFSFANYYNPNKLGFGKLLVINDDIISPSKGFNLHSHDNMEIITIMLEGSIAHKDSMGNSYVIKENEIQAMSAGSGIIHSEFNPSKAKKTKLLQIWILPSEENIKPKYAQKEFKFAKNKLTYVVSNGKIKDTLKINQTAFLSIAKFEKNENLNYKLNNKSNGTYVFIIEGKIKINNNTLKERDTIEISETDSFNIKFLEESKILFIEVPLN